MKASSRLCLLLSAGLLSGCGGPVLVVHRAPTASVPATGDDALPGVPFYVKTAGCKHQTVWLQPIYTLTLKKTVTSEKSTDKPAPADKPQLEIQTKVVVLTLSQYRKDAVASLRVLLSGGGDQPTPEAVIDAWVKVEKLAVGDPYGVDEDQLSGADSGRVIRVANQVTPEKYVDFRTTYYYNTKRPLSGSAQASIKLGDDGTMTEGSAQVESKTLQTFLSLLPVNDVLSKVAAANLGFLAEEKGPTTYKFELSTDTRVFRHTHEALLRDPNNNSTYLMPPCPEEENDVTAPYNLTVEDATEAKKETGDGSIVKVSGSIVLPKPEEKKK